MLDRLPELIDPLQFAEGAREIKGELAISSLTRLTDILAENHGVVAVSLSFGRDNRLSWIKGRVKTLLKLQCQNCLNFVDLPIDHQFKLGIVSSVDEADLLPESFEPLLIKEDKIATREIIEEELLLIIPAFPKHKTDCFKEKLDVDPPLAQQAEESNNNNPFSALAKLKNTGDT